MPTHQEKIIELRGVKKAFGSRVVLPCLDLDILHGEFVTLLGPSGCGKTTILRLIGGFETLDAGAVFLAGKDISELDPSRRPVNTVFQSYALFPHMSVFDNVAYGLRAERRPRREIRQRVARVLEMVELQELAQRKPDQLSGGEQQRVAIARAVVKGPRVLLLDEPLSALDFKLRKQMQSELKRLQRELGITFLFITHDQEEALSMSDRVVVLRDGVIEQIGTPRNIYESPANLFIARFVGDSNVFDLTVSEIPHAGALVGFSEGVELELRSDSRRFRVGENICMLLRPEEMRLLPATSEKGFPGRVIEHNYKGMMLETLIRLSSGKVVQLSRLFSEDATGIDCRLGEQVRVDWVSGSEALLPYEAD